MTKIEKQLLLLSGAFASAILIINPFISIPALSLFSGPSGLFQFDPWYYPIPFMFLIFLAIGYAFYPRVSKIYRIIIWAISLFYWGPWSDYLAGNLKPFIKSWHIWCPHVALTIMSLIGLYKVTRPNKTFSRTRDRAG